MSTTPPLLSIIIVSYRTKAVLEACLRSVKEQVDLPAEVIVIDNASTDGSADMVAHGFPEFRLIRSKVNRGFSPANNMGMEMATGKYILLLNPDTVVLACSIREWVNGHERVGAAVSGPSLVNQNGSDQVSAWRIPDAMDALLEALFLHRLFRRTHYPASAFLEDKEVGFVSGAAMLFERTVFHLIGGLDPELFWMEDTDFCLRAKKDGGTCYRLHGPKIIHIGGQSSSKDPGRMISNQLISRIKFARKYNDPMAQVIVIVAVYFQVLSRIVAFAVVDIFRSEPRAAAYRYTFGKLNRYLFKDDRSI